MKTIHPAAAASAAHAAHPAERAEPPPAPSAAPAAPARELADDPGAVEYASWLRLLGTLAAA